MQISQLWWSVPKLRRHCSRPKDSIEEHFLLAIFFLNLGSGIDFLISALRGKSIGVEIEVYWCRERSLQWGEKSKTG